jgi:hypothetical protein
MLGRAGRVKHTVEATARRATPSETTAAEPEVFDLPALHRSLNEKKKAVRILVAFARELAGG